VLIHSNLCGYWLHASAVLFSLSIGSKILGGISVSDLNQNVFLIGKLIAEIGNDSIKRKGKILLEQFNLCIFL
jgi:hypothetical protein